MAWRIADSIERGEIDNRTRDRVVGKLWLCGREEPVQLELTGNPWRDLAGQYLRFFNPDPKPLPEHHKNFAAEQTGTVGDMTAARKVKVLDIADDEFEHYYTNKIPMPYHWGNCLYLEWYSTRNGRVVIEATNYNLKVEPEPAWRMSEAEEAGQHETNARAMTGFVDQIVEAAGQAEALQHEDDDHPQSDAEAKADAEAARMELLLDRVTARMDREECDDDLFEEIFEEECERLRKERGEPEPPSPKQQTEIDEMIAAASASIDEVLFGDPAPVENREHPLVEHCHELGIRVHDDIECNSWLPQGAHEEHPLHELVDGIWSASAKLAGALNGDPNDWPPDPEFAGHTLVRLKKARGYLNDAMAGLESAEAEKLCEAAWLHNLRQELIGLQQTVQGFIDEVRTVLRRNDDSL